jgi:hypothetical protein
VLTYDIIQPKKQPKSVVFIMELRFSDEKPINEIKNSRYFIAQLTPIVEQVLPNSFHPFCLVVQYLQV